MLPTVGRALGALVLALIALPGALADQRDPRLDTLFESLAQAPPEPRSSEIERRIWALWSESGDADIDRLLALGTEAMMSGRLREAIATFDEVVERAPGFAEGWNKRATALYYADQPDASVRDIQRTLALEPRHFGAISGLGLIFMQRRDLRGALMAFERVLTVHPGSAHARLQVEWLRQKLGAAAV